MNEEQKLIRQLEDLHKSLKNLYKALDEAIEGLKVLKDQEPVAQKTLEEIEKIYKEISES